jgi:hypothetical protein
MPTAPNDDELQGLGTLPAHVDCGRVRLFRPGERGAAGALRRVVLGLSGGRAIALGNAVFMPERCADDLAVLAHELTHCGQYQRWGALRYFTQGAREQLRDLVVRVTGRGTRPYAYVLEPGRPFASYGMEQQGQIVEDCWRGDPAARAVAPYSPGPE